MGGDIGCSCKNKELNCYIENSHEIDFDVQINYNNRKQQDLEVNIAKQNLNLHYRNINAVNGKSMHTKLISESRKVLEDDESVYSGESNIKEKLISKISNNKIISKSNKKKLMKEKKLYRNDTQIKTMYTEETTQSPIMIAKQPNTKYRAFLMEHIYLKNILLKYHLGFTSAYIQKYCKITKNYFSYCKPQCEHDSSCSFVRIEYRDIAEVKRVDAHFGKVKDNLFHFEIFMKPGWTLKYSSLSKLYMENYVLNRSECNDSEGFSLTTLISKECKEETINEPVIYNNINFNSETEVRSFMKYSDLQKASVLTIKENDSSKKEREKKSNTVKSMKGCAAKERLVFGTQSEEECKQWVLVMNWLIEYID